MKELASQLLTLYGGEERNAGKVLNKLQDIAEKILSKRQQERFFLRINTDMDRCEGSDYMLINGSVYDWRTFDYKQVEMIESFLGYFPPEKLTEIELYIKGGKK